MLRPLLPLGWDGSKVLRFQSYVENQAVSGGFLLVVGYFIINGTARTVKVTLTLSE